MNIKKILLSPQEFKEILSGYEVASAMKEGILKVDSSVKIDISPVADGGDGTLKTMVDVTNGNIIEETVENPLGDEIQAEWGNLGTSQTAVIEMARASGLALLSENEKSALKTTTYGTGQLFKAALDQGIKKFILAIGGSATNDGGAGFASAIGARLLDKNNNEIYPSGENLSLIDKIDLSNLDQRIKDIEVQVACDVNNPLCGETGASAIFGPQKGASTNDIEILDRIMYITEKSKVKSEIKLEGIYNQYCNHIKKYEKRIYSVLGYIFGITTSFLIYKYSI